MSFWFLSFLLLNYQSTKIYLMLDWLLLKSVCFSYNLEGRRRTLSLRTFLKLYPYTDERCFLVSNFYHSPTFGFILCWQWTEPEFQNLPHPFQHCTSIHINPPVTKPLAYVSMYPPTAARLLLGCCCQQIFINWP